MAMTLFHTSGSVKLIMARDPALLAAFSELSALTVIRPGRLDPGLKALIMYMVSGSAGCRYCAAHTANLAGLRDVPTSKIEALGQFERSPEFSEAERAALRFAQAAVQVKNAVTDADFAELRLSYAITSSGSRCSLFESIFMMQPSEHRSLFD